MARARVNSHVALLCARRQALCDVAEVLLQSADAVECVCEVIWNCGSYGPRSAACQGMSSPLLGWQGLNRARV